MKVQRFAVCGVELVNVADIVSVTGTKGGVKVAPLFLTTDETKKVLGTCRDMFLWDEESFPKRVTLSSINENSNPVMFIYKELGPEKLSSNLEKHFK